MTKFASLVLRATYDGELLFNPYNSHSELHPAGGLNRLRRDASRSSRKAPPMRAVIAREGRTRASYRIGGHPDCRVARGHPH